MKRRKGKGKGKGKGQGSFKRIGNAYIGEEQNKTMIGGQKKIVFGGPRKKAFRKEITNFLNSILVLFFKIQIQTRSSSQTKERVQIRIEEEKKVHILNQDFLPQNRQVKKGESDDWYSNFTDDSSSSATRGTTAWYGTRHTA